MCFDGPRQVVQPNWDRCHSGVGQSLLGSSERRNERGQFLQIILDGWTAVVEGLADAPYRVPGGLYGRLQRRIGGVRIDRVLPRPSCGSRRGRHSDLVEGSIRCRKDVGGLTIRRAHQRFAET
ncbi:hypothetical protein [Streptomyces sp. NBC_00829]|uniref:hypothetical protein n=1 Tax=Streptomyces sp. NBC_00829 TaxID=2903679 RepID=UPI003870B6BB|nr:hypothetical protein OG293_33125 [Streptomyces sp. NBC_00829]